MIIPCIDLQGGKAVQLVRGRRRALAVDDVLGLLDRFRDYPILHVIDLDAAMRKGSNARWIKLLCREANRKVRVGGGIRTVARAERILSWGAEKIIVGSAAFRDGKVAREFLGCAAQARRTQARDRGSRYGRRPDRGARLARTIEASPSGSDSGARALLFGIPFHVRGQRRHDEGHRSFVVPSACSALPSCPSPRPAEFAACAR